MKRILPLLILAIVTFAIVWLILQGISTDGRDVELEGRKTPFESTGQEPFALRERDPRSHRGVIARTTKLSSDEAKPGMGKIVVLATLPDGTTPQELQIVTKPVLPRFAYRAGGRELDAVPAGGYVLTVCGGDLLPVVYRALKVEAGKEKRLVFKVRRGVRPKGIVRDAADNTPIAGALVDFNGLARVTTDASGHFDVVRVLPRSALDVITIANEDYGTIPFKGLNIEDIGNMKLFLGGGKGVVNCEIVNGTSIELPKDAFLRVTLPPLYEVRREMPLNGREIFQIRKMYEGTFRFEIHFPSGEFPTQRQRVKVPSWLPDKPPIANVRFVLEPGATLRGKFLAPPSFTNGMLFQLRDRRNHVLAEAKVDRKGHYRFNNLAAREYIPVVVAGGTHYSLPFIVIEGDGVIDRDVDVLRKKWAK